MLRVLAPTLVALALLAPAAHAADSHAPEGARLDWLPTDDWVMSSWLPYDEAKLYAALDPPAPSCPPTSTTVAASATSPARAA